jgi:hypothetical protein
MNPETELLDRYIEEISAHLGRMRGKQEELRELRSAILDRAEESGEGEVSKESMQAAIKSLGDPAEVALSYAGKKYLIAPRLYRTFVTYTGILFAIHIVMILTATAMDAAIRVFPVMALRVAQPNSFGSLLFVVSQALFMDIGLMVVLFTIAARSGRTLRAPSLAFRSHSGTRVSIARAIFAVLVLLILNFLRDELFFVVAQSGRNPLFTEAFGSCLPPINIYLLVVILREMAFARLGERKWLVFLDALLSAAGAALMIWLLTRPTFLAFPQQVNEAMGSTMFTLNQILSKILKLLLIAFAAAFTVEAAKRLFRLRQI